MSFRPKHHSKVTPPVESEETRNKIEQVINDQKVEKGRLDEERLKEKKKNNLMIYNIPEEEFEDTMLRMEDDFKKLKETYAEKNITVTEKDLVQINRIGEKRRDHVRPVVITLVNQEKRMELLTNNKNLKLKHEHEVINIYVATDKTPKQRDAEKILRDELNRRKDAGETDLGIRNNKIVKSVPFPGGAQQSWASRFRQ